MFETSVAALGIALAAASATPGPGSAAERARPILGLPADAPFPEGELARGRGTAHIRFPQAAGGIPIEGAELRLHYDARGRLIRTDSTWRADPPPIGELRIPPAEAECRALAYLAARGKPEPIELRDAGPIITRYGELAREIRARIAEPPELLRIRIDARSGAILEARDMLRRADGEGRVFLPNPVVALRDGTLRDQDDSASAVPEEAYVRVTLPELDLFPGKLGTLTGPYVSTEGTPNRAREPTLRFLYDRSHPGFEEVMVYYHIDRVARLVHDLGFRELCRRQIRVFVNSQPPGIPLLEDVSYFQPTSAETGFIAFGSGGVDDAEDGEIIVHEYAHAIQHEQVPYFGETGEAEAIGEGFCDFLATASFIPWSGGFGDECFGDWDARGYASGTSEFRCLRSIPSLAVWPDDLRGRPHLDGLIYASALWAILRSIGPEEAISLAIEANFFLRPTARFRDLGPALLDADRAIHEGAHERILREILLPRGLLPQPLRIEGYALAGGLPIRIPDADPQGVTSAVRWENDPRILTGRSLRVYVDIAHAFPGDIDVWLTAPDGTRVRLTPPRTFPAIFGGTVEPRDSFDALAGGDARGTWTLQVIDRFAGDVGSIEAWGIRIANLVRGETNGDGRIDLGDPIAILDHLFAGGDLPCETVADIDDNGRLDLADPIRLLDYLFAGGPPPAEPFSIPGHDPTPDDLACGRDPGADDF